MGDIIADAFMASDSKHDTVVRVGFLNKLSDPLMLESYMETFDLVISDDGSLCPVLSLLEEIAGEQTGRGYKNLEGSLELQKILGSL